MHSPLKKQSTFLVELHKFVSFYFLNSQSSSTCNNHDRSIFIPDDSSSNLSKPSGILIFVVNDNDKIKEIVDYFNKTWMLDFVVVLNSNVTENTKIDGIESLLVMYPNTFYQYCEKLKKIQHN